MNDDARAYEERRAIIEAQRQVEAAENLAARLYAQQVDQSLHTTTIGDWQSAQEYQREQEQNAREAQLAREHFDYQARLAQER